MIIAIRLILTAILIYMVYEETGIFTVVALLLIIISIELIQFQLIKIMKKLNIL